MADGKEILRDDILVVNLLDGDTATTSGVWVPMGPYRHNVSVHIQGITIATVQIFGDSTQTTAGTLPANGTDYTQIGASQSADTHFSVGATVPFWIKAKISAYTSGTIYAVLTASRVD